MGASFIEHDGPIPRKAELAILGVIGCTGIALNLLVLLTAALTLRVPRTLHILLLILTVLDLMSLLLYVPTYMRALASGSLGSLSRSTCSAVVMAFYACQCSSVVVNAILAFSRAVLSQSQKRYMKLFTVRRTLAYSVLACAVSILALFLCLIILASTRWQLPGDINAICRKTGFHLAAHTSIIWPFVFFLPLYFTAVCYLRVYLCIRSVRDGGGRYKRDCYEGGFTFLMACFVLLTVWLPFLVVKTFDPYQERIPAFGHRVALYLVLTNGIANPLVYTLRVSDFRKGVQRVFGLPSARKSTTDTLYNEDWGGLAEEFRERTNPISRIGSRVSRASRSSKYPSRPMSRAASRKRPLPQAPHQDCEAVVPSLVPEVTHQPNVVPSREGSRNESTDTNKTYVAVHDII